MERIVSNGWRSRLMAASHGLSADPSDGFSVIPSVPWQTDDCNRVSRFSNTLADHEWLSLLFWPPIMGYSWKISAFNGQSSSSDVMKVECQSRRKTHQRSHMVNLFPYWCAAYWDTCTWGILLWSNRHPKASTVLKMISGSAFIAKINTVSFLKKENYLCHQISCKLILPS